jgi:serine/threonine-protein kinase
MPRPAANAAPAPHSAITRAVAGPARPREESPAETVTAPTPSTVATAAEALEQGAVNRLRLYRIAMISWCLGGVLATLMMPGLLRDRIICWISVAIFLGSYALREEAESPSQSVRLMLPVAIVQALGAMGVCVGLGIASPFHALLVIGLVLYGLSAPREHSTLVFGLLVGSFAVLAGLSLLDVLPGTGLLSPEPLPFGTKLANAAWVEGTYVTGYLVGRFARRDSARLVEQLERVVRESAHREALLREAREELARVVKVGGRGPFTGVDLGSFRLGAVIGRGGMGEVYAATRAGDTREAAVKLLRRDVLSQPDIVKRFEREAKIVASLRSPHIVEVLGIGGEDAPLPYIAMERLRGDDLVGLLRARGALDLDEAITLVREVGDGLAVAHAAGVVHRDLKPANLFHNLSAADVERWIILDFGVSKLLLSDEGTLTTNEVLGTPHYMAPEQAYSKRSVDARSDLYSLGVIVYRALTGQLAFARNDLGDVIHAVQNDMPEDPRALRPLPEDVALWLRIAIAKRPADRFTTAQEMAETFALAARHQLPQAYRERARVLLGQQMWGEKGRVSLSRQAREGR